MKVYPFVLLYAILANSFCAEIIERNPIKYESDSPTLKWPVKYSVMGTLNLPYAKLSEPFMAWIDTNINCSRIDYYADTLTSRIDVPTRLLFSEEKSNPPALIKTSPRLSISNILIFYQDVNRP